MLWLPLPDRPGSGYSHDSWESLAGCTVSRCSVQARESSLVRKVKRLASPFEVNWDYERKSTGDLRPSLKANIWEAYPNGSVHSPVPKHQWAFRIEDCASSAPCHIVCTCSSTWLSQSLCIYGGQSCQTGPPTFSLCVYSW